MSEHENCNTGCSSDSAADAKAVVGLLAIVVITACFWLLGR